MIYRNRLFELYVLYVLLREIKSSNALTFYDKFFNLMKDKDFNIIEYVDGEDTNFDFEAYEDKVSYETSNKEEEKYNEDDPQPNEFFLPENDQISVEEMISCLKRDTNGFTSYKHTSNLTIVDVEDSFSEDINELTPHNSTSDLTIVDVEDSLSEDINELTPDNTTSDLTIVDVEGSLSEDTDFQMARTKDVRNKRQNDHDNFESQSFSSDLKRSKKEHLDFTTSTEENCPIKKFKNQILMLKEILRIKDTSSYGKETSKEILKYCVYSNSYKYHSKTFIFNLEFEEKITQFLNAIENVQFPLKNVIISCDFTSYRTFAIRCLFKTFTYNLEKDKDIRDQLFIDNASYHSYINMEMCNIFDTVKTVSLDSFRSYYMILNEIRKLKKNYQGLPEIFYLEAVLRVDNIQEGYLGVYILLRVMNNIIETNLDHEKIYLCFSHICILLDLQKKKSLHRNIQYCSKRETIYNAIKEKKVNFCVALLSVWQILPAESRSFFRINHKIPLDTEIDINFYCIEKHMLNLFLCLNITLYNNNFKDQDLELLHIQEENVALLSSFIECILKNRNGIKYDYLREAIKHIYSILFN